MKKIILILAFCNCLAWSAAQSACFLFPAASAFADEGRWEAGCQSQCRLAGTFTAYSGLMLPFDGDKSSSFLLRREQLGDFRRLRCDAAYSQSFGSIFSLAISCSYHSLSFSDPFYGCKRGAAVSLSACFRPAETYSVVFAWENPFALPYWVDGEQRERIPSGLRAACVYRGMESLAVTIGAEKNFFQPASYGLLLEGSPAESWRWRLGCGFPYFRLLAGGGIVGKRCRCEFFALLHSGWGPMLCMSVSGGFRSGGKGGVHE